MILSPPVCPGDLLDPAEEFSGVLPAFSGYPAGFA